MIHSEYISQFLTFLRDVVNENQAAKLEEADADNKTQDLLHELELGDNNYHDTAKLAKGLREVRVNRRKAKDTIMITDSIVKWEDTNKRFIELLKQLLGEVRKAEKYVQDRHYAERTSIVDDVLGNKNKDEETT